MGPMRLATLLLLLPAALVAFCGCGSADSGRVPVRGTVSYQDEPVARGSISLRPVRGTSGPAAGTDITGGKFEIPADTGPGTGSYTARITIVWPDDSPPAGPLDRGPRNVQTVEVPVEIEADREEYEFHLPLAAEDANL